ncbi:MAG: hypothetical protein R3C11_19675 [Planctomycetaceae bacterium]
MKLKEYSFLNHSTNRFIFTTACLVILSEVLTATPAFSQTKVFEIISVDEETENDRNKNNFPDWDIKQATGAPDTFRYGDQRSAWASYTQDGEPEWLTLSYEPAVQNPRMILIFETFNPGAITQVSAIPPQKIFSQYSFIRSGAGQTNKATPVYPTMNINEEEAVVWSGEVEKLPAEINVKSIPLNVKYPIDRVKLTIASDEVKGWNEIDAVGIVDNKGEIHWATAATASSTYAVKSSQQVIQSRFESPFEQTPVTRREFNELTVAIESLTREIQDLKAKQQEPQPKLEPLPEQPQPEQD